ncbi:MAG TPA: response regulator transcription factor, partial [Ktedonobacteraceae bacterium]
DHVLIRQAICHILSSQPEIERVVAAQDYAEAREYASKLQPDIIWLDLHVNYSNSITEIGRLRKLSPTSRIIVLADQEDGQEAFAAIMVGAQGYRSKQDLDEAEVMCAIHMILRGEFVLRPVLAAHVVQRLRGESNASSVSIFREQPYHKAKLFTSEALARYPLSLTYTGPSLLHYCGCCDFNSTRL